MKAQEFCYWLQGYFEIGGKKELTEQQVEMIQKHLSMVFVHDIDPQYPQQDKLNHLHNNTIARC